MDEAGWRKELVDQRAQMLQFALIPNNAISGVRAPQLVLGGDPMYKVLKDANIKYDCSRPTNSFRESGLWPYTNDFASIQDCVIPPCPVNEYKGLWTVPMINLIGDDTSQIPCSMADQCQPEPKTEQATFDLLNKNFQRHYTGHRAPFGVFIRHGWVNGTAGDDDESIRQRRLGYEKFLDSLDGLNDVYIVSIERGLKWVQNPTPLKDVAKFEAFQVPAPVNRCVRTQTCEYRAGQTPFKPPLAQER